MFRHLAQVATAMLKSSVELAAVAEREAEATQSYTALEQRLSQQQALS